MSLKFGPRPRAEEQVQSVVVDQDAVEAQDPVKSEEKELKKDVDKEPTWADLRDLQKKVASKQAELTSAEEAEKQEKRSWGQWALQPIGLSGPTELQNKVRILREELSKLEKSEHECSVSLEGYFSKQKLDSLAKEFATLGLAGKKDNQQPVRSNDAWSPARDAALRAVLIAKNGKIARGENVEGSAKAIEALGEKQKQKQKQVAKLK